MKSIIAIVLTLLLIVTGVSVLKNIDSLEKNELLLYKTNETSDGFVFCNEQETCFETEAAQTIYNTSTTFSENLFQTGIRIKPAKASTEPVTLSIPELNDKNVLSFVRDSIVCFSNTQWDFNIKYDEEIVSEPGLPTVYNCINGEEYCREWVLVKNYNSKNDILKYINKYLTGELLDGASKTLDELFDDKIFYEYNGNLYFLRHNYLYERGAFEVFLPATTVYKCIGEGKYIIVLFGSAGCTYGENTLDSDYYIVEYKDGIYKLESYEEGYPEYSITMNFNDNPNDWVAL